MKLPSRTRGTGDSSRPHFVLIHLPPRLGPISSRSDTLSGSYMHVARLVTVTELSKAYLSDLHQFRTARNGNRKPVHMIY